MKSAILSLIVVSLWPRAGSAEPLGAPRAEIQGGTITTISRIDWANGGASTSPAVPWGGGILNMPPGFSDGVDNEGGGVSGADFILHTTTAGIKDTAVAVDTTAFRTHYDASKTTSDVKLNAVNLGTGMMRTDIAASTRAAVSFFSNALSTQNAQVLILTNFSSTASAVDKALGVDTTTLLGLISGGGLPLPDFIQHTTTAGIKIAAIAVDTTTLKFISAGNIVGPATIQAAQHIVGQFDSVSAGGIVSFGSATAWGGITSTRGFVAPSSTFTILTVSGSTIAVGGAGGNTPFSLVFASPPVVGQHLVATKVNSPFVYIAGGGDQGGGGGSGLALADFILHTTTADTKNAAYLNVVASSGTTCRRIPATAALEVAVGTITITPILATSGIKLSGSFLAVKDSGATARDMIYTIRRGILRTDPRVGPFLAARSQAVATTTFMPTALFALDYPGTTNAVTYTIGAWVTAGLSSYTAYNLIAEEVPIP